MSVRRGRGRAWRQGFLLAAALLAACGGDSSPSDEGFSVGLGDGTELDVPPVSPPALVASFGVDEPSAPVAIGSRLFYLDNKTLASFDPSAPRAGITTYEGVDRIIGTLDDRLVVDSDAGVVVLGTPDLAIEVRLATPEDVGSIRSAAVDADTGRVVIGFSDNVAAVFSTTDGAQLWRVERPGRVEPVAIGGGTVAARWVRLEDDVADEEIVTMDADTGDVTGVYEAEGDVEPVLLAVTGPNEVLLSLRGDSSTGSSGGWLAMVDMAGPEEVWRVSATTWFDKPLILDDVIAAPNQEEALHLVDRPTGTSSTVPTGSRVAEAPVAHGSNVVMVNAAAEVIVIDPAAGEQATEPFVLPEVDQIHGWTLIGDILYVTGTERIINVDDDPDHLYAVDVTRLTPVP